MMRKEITQLERKQLERLSAFKLFQVEVLLESGVASTMSEALREVYAYREHQEGRRHHERKRPLW